MTPTQPPHHLKLAVDNGALPPSQPPSRTGPARPIPEDYGLTASDLRVWYAPGRAGAAVGLVIAAGTALIQAIDGGRHADPWILGAVSGLLYGAFIGGLAGLGGMVLVLWADPVIGRLWPVYGRLRRYRDALAQARRAEPEQPHG